MQVSAIDHINIAARDLPATIHFYEGLLGLRKSGDYPGTAMGVEGAWLCDDDGNALIHLSKGGGDAPPAVQGSGRSTGALDHVAFRCHDYDGVLGRLAAMNIDYREVDLTRFGLRQIVLCDPNDIALELNFRIS